MNKPKEKITISLDSESMKVMDTFREHQGRSRSNFIEHLIKKTHIANYENKCLKNN